MHFNNKRSLVAVLTAGMLLTGCNKLVNVDSPDNSINGEDIFKEEVNAIGLMTGVYTKMSSTGYGAPNAAETCVNPYTGMSSDEVTLIPAVRADPQNAANFFYRNQLTSNQEFGYWEFGYNYIYTANKILEGVKGSSKISAAAGEQLQGEAKFIRAYNYFYLVNLFGDVPLTTTSNYKANNLLTRTAKEKVYEQMVEDLKDAANLLSEKYLQADLKTETDERVRPTKYAALALLARVYLYLGQFDLAEQTATAVIDRKELFDTVSIGKTFLKNTKETIWSLQGTSPEINTTDARMLVLPPDAILNLDHPFVLNPILLDSFETGDWRRSQWVGKYVDQTVTPNVDYFYANKYKSWQLRDPLTEYRIILRISEQYLIRAEARARQQNTIDAASDLNVIRHRAGLPNTTASTPEELASAVMHERQTELFLEGHRWFDLKRTGTVDAVMSVATAAKGGIWQSYQQLYPIPRVEIIKVPGMVQNQGY